MRCPRCGNTRLVWDHVVYGYIVCPACGLVIEQIIDDEHASPEDEIDAAPGRTPLPSLRAPRSLRIAVALEVYRSARMEGFGRAKAIELAARASGLSPRTVRNAVVRYRLAADGLWEGINGGSAGGPGLSREEDSRANV